MKHRRGISFYLVVFLIPLCVLSTFVLPRAWGQGTHTLELRSFPTGLDFLPATQSRPIITITIGGGATGWRASTGASFLSLASRSGEGSGEMVITCSANTGTFYRTGEVTITTTGEGTVRERTLSLTQTDALAQGLFVLFRGGLPSPNDVGADGHSGGEFEVRLRGGAKRWTAVANQTWINLSVSSGEHLSRVNWGVASNTGAPRRGEVRLTTSGDLGASASAVIEFRQRNMGGDLPPRVRVMSMPTDLNALPATMGTVTATCCY